jgi:hypothetical protein
VAGSAVDGGAPRMAKVSYRLISGGSVLVETWGVAAPTMTMVHLDGKNLVATHYCGQGNQPRLRMTSATSSSIVFEYWDATNLSSADQSHMVRLELVLVGANQFTHKEVYASGKKRDADELTFTRVTPSR